MSSSDFTALTHRLGEAAHRVLAEGSAAQLASDDLRRLITAAVQLYAAANEGGEQDTNPLEPGVSTTDAVVLASALLKAEDLNPFDLALWFNRGRAAG